LERFRRRGRAAAQQRLTAAFENSDLPMAPQPDIAAEETSAQWKELLAKAEVMGHAGEVLMRKATPEDAADLQRHLDSIAQAKQARDQASLEQVLAQMEYLLFYLQDATA
jgi:hypothetical protein